MGRADGTFLQAVGLTPWVETHGYKIYRADGSSKETLQTKRFEAIILTEQVVLPVKLLEG
jgi:hypothetical protein